MLVLVILALCGACSAIRPEGWCGTEHVQPTESNKRADGCGLKVGCDTPAVRELYATSRNLPAVTVRTQWIVPFSALSGSSFKETAQKNIRDNMALLNKTYADMDIQFSHAISFVQSSLYSGRVEDDDTTYMKNDLAVNWRTHINLFYVDYIDALGIATWPWAQSVGTKQHGILLRRSYVNAKGYTLVHEMGHELGLLHTHQSVASGKCGACLDTAGSKSNELGDLIGDTPPTPTNFECRDVTSSDSCSGLPWAPTDFKNWMGYSDDDCMVNGHFSPSQKARARCFTLNMLQRYIEFESCSTVEDCNTGNKCFPSECVKPDNGLEKHCRYTEVVCKAPATCETNKCDPQTGKCSTAPKLCLPPHGLENCSVASCNPINGKCKQNITACEHGETFSNDCCKESSSPFCKNRSVAECVCAVQSHCCFNKWDTSCVDTADRYCGQSCSPPLAAFRNYNKNYAMILGISDLPKLFRGRTANPSSHNCSAFTSDPIGGYGAWFNILSSSTPGVLQINTCDPDPRYRNYAPTSVLVISDNSSFSCIEWAEQSEGCDGLVKMNYTHLESVQWIYVYVYTTQPADLTIGLRFIPPNPSPQPLPTPPPEASDSFSRCMNTYCNGCSGSSLLFWEGWCTMLDLLPIWAWILIFVAAGLIIIAIPFLLCACCCKAKKPVDESEFGLLSDGGYQSDYQAQ